MRYLDGHGVLRRLLQTATSRGFLIDEVPAEPLNPRALLGTDACDDDHLVEVRLLVHGRYPVNELASAMSDVDDVASVLVGDEASASG